MARPNQSRQDNAPGFAPETRQAPSLGVFAPLNVSAAPARAQALADALGVATRIATPQLTQAIEKNAFDRTTSGKADAANNAIDTKRQQEDALYDKGVKQMVAEKRVVEVIQEYSQRYETEFDKQLGEHMLAEDIDSFAKSKLGDLINDPEMAKVVAGRMLPFMQQMTGKHRQNLSREFQQEAIDTTVSSIHADVDLGMQTDFEGNVQRLASILGDRTKANATVVGAIVERAVALGAPGIIDTFIPNDVKGGVNVRATYAEQIEKGRASAQAASDERDAHNIAVAKGDIEIGFVDRINGQQWLTNRELLQLQKEKKITEGERVSWYSRSESARLSLLESQQKNAFLDIQSTLDPERRLPSYVGALGPDGKPLTERDMKNIGNRKVEQMVTASVAPDASPEDKRAVLVQSAANYTRREGYVYEPLANDMSTVLPAHGEAFASAAKTYAALDPTVRDFYVTDRDQQARFSQFNTLVALGNDPKEAASAMAKVSPEVVSRNREVAREKSTKRREQLNARTVHDSWMPGDEIKVGDLVNSGAVSAEIEKRAQALIGAGSDADTAFDTATESVTKAWVAIPGPKNKSALMVPRSAGVTEDTPKHIEWLYNSYLPKWLKDHGSSLTASDVRLAPVPGSDENTLFTIVDATTMSLVARGQAMTLGGLARVYDEDRRKRGLEAAAEAARIKALPPGIHREEDFSKRFIAR